MITIKSVSGQLPNAKGTLYTAPALTSAIIRRISYVNVTAGAITVNMYLKKAAGTSTRIMAKDFSLGAGAPPYREDGIITLEPGDSIEGDASAITSIDYVISLIQKT